ncbi:12764_t:CDS:2, partial [Dentiscutata erythropus]
KEERVKERNGRKGKVYRTEGKGVGEPRVNNITQVEANSVAEDKDHQESLRQ